MFPFYDCLGCGYSVSARMAFAALADKMTYEGNPILIGALDCDESKDVRKTKEK